MLALGALGVCAGLAPPAGAAARGFELGVAAGDVTARSAILWAKAKRSGTAAIQVEAGRLGRCDLEDSPRRLTVEAEQGNEHGSGIAPGPAVEHRPRGRRGYRGISTIS